MLKGDQNNQEKPINPDQHRFAKGHKKGFRERKSVPTSQLKARDWEGKEFRTWCGFNHEDTTP